MAKYKVMMDSPDIAPVTVEASGYRVEKGGLELSFYLDGNDIASFSRWLYVIKEDNVRGE